jgi:nitroimidazol reductase NimA-like FMN-containing flavoprotein (pyridoxamine 5'-phosphate oxidase superfamily)
MIVRSVALEEHHNMTTLATPEPEALPLDAPATYPFPKSREGLLPWSRVEELLAAAPNYWLATVRPDGRPHIAPIWGGWLDGAFYFQGAPDSRWARNLRTNPHVSVHLESVRDVVIVDGEASHIVTDSGLAARLVEDWERKYGDPEHPPQADTFGIYRLRPRTVRAWGEALNDGARWIFGDV